MKTTPYTAARPPIRTPIHWGNMEDAEWGNGITYIAQTALKGSVVPFGIKDGDRARHTYVTGRVGSGRTDILARMLFQDIERGVSAIVLDASGTFSQMLLERVSDNARERVVFLDPSDGEHPFSWNPVREFSALGDRALPLLSEALASMYGIEAGSLTAFTAEHLLAHPEQSTLLLFNLVTDPKARENAFGEGAPERARFEDALKSERETAEFISEHGRYIAKDTLIRNILGQSDSKFTLAAEDLGAFVVVDLSRIRMFPTRMQPLVRIFAHAARARALLGEHVALYCYDVLKHLSEKDIASIFPERSVMIAAAGILQSEEEQSRIESGMRQCGAVLSFAPNPADFPLLEHAFYPYVSPEDLAKLKESEICLMLTIDGVRSKPFFAQALPKPPRGTGSVQDIHVISRDRFTISRLKADQLFRAPRPEKPQEGSGQGSFSNAFRSIFAKKPDQSGTSPGAPSAAAQKTAPSETPKASPSATAPAVTATYEKPEETSKNSKAPAETRAPSVLAEETAASPAEIPEEELRKMVYVDPSDL